MRVSHQCKGFVVLFYSSVSELWTGDEKRSSVFSSVTGLSSLHVSSHLSLVYIHTVTPPVSMGRQCHRAPQLKADWVGTDLLQVPLGRDIRPW